MEKSLFRYILRYSKREQLAIVPFVVASMVVYFFSLDLPKTIINEAIQGKVFTSPDATATFLELSFTLPQALGGATWQVFEGFALERIPYLMALSLLFLLLIILGGVLKFHINTLKGWMGERMLRRLRYALLDLILRFPLARFRRVKSSELATMIKDEVEPLGGFVGEALITPLFLGGQALTAVIFILMQHFYLGMIAVVMVSIQAVVIPRLRLRLLTLARQRQLGARHLAGRIAECADGVVEIHAHDTSNFERAEISARLGKLFRIRFEYYQRKFLIKFINNFLSQVTPFLFYVVGGYLVIIGRLDIGALVAVIAAYKDLPTPVKELIDWDQERLDTSIKYAQVLEQFTVEDIMPAGMQALQPAAPVPRHGAIVVSSLTLADESSTRVIDGVSFEAGLDRHIALLGDSGSGRSELTQLIARLAPPTGGSIVIGDTDITRAPESVTGRAIGYVGAASYLFPVSVRDNLLYSLKHYPVIEAEYRAHTQAEREFQLREARRAGNTTLDINADWIDYAAVGASGAKEIEEHLHEALVTLELEGTIFELGLRSTVDLDQSPELSEVLVRARAAMQERLSRDGLRGLVERFDPDRYIRNASLAENLLFGTPVGGAFDIEHLAAHPFVHSVLAETGLAEDMLRIGHKVASTMVELFSGLPPGHEMFERFSFIREDELPVLQDLLSRVPEQGLHKLDDAERDQLLNLPFRLIAAKHRLGLIDETFEARILKARAYFAAHLPTHLRSAVEFFDPAACNRALSLSDNILFGKIVSTQAGATARISQVLRRVLDEQGLRSTVISVGLNFQVGVGGTRLAAADRQKIAIARALLKRPSILVLDQAEAVLDPASQKQIVSRVLQHRRGACVIWALQRAELAELFDEALVLQHGRLAERGRYADLKSVRGTVEEPA